jgi:ANTAR domain
MMEPIRVRTPSAAHAQRLIAALDGTFSATLNGGSPATEVELRLDRETATKLVGLFDAVGVWLSDGGLEACQIGFGERSYTLLAALVDKPNDAAGFLLERTIQLQTALDSRVVIEQAKGILAEREGIPPDQAFLKMRGQARGRRMKLHDLAAGIVSEVSDPAENCVARDQSHIEDAVTG